MPTRDEQMQELVKKMGKVLRAIHGVGYEEGRIERRHSDLRWLEGQAEFLIASVLKAVVDGMPLPGEVGRSKGTYLPGIGECETIALSPTGTGEEE